MKISQAILPVAGLGTRFLPWTKVVPKELLPIGKKPIIAHLVDECLSVGIDDICFIINRDKEAIPQYFQSAPVLESELKRRGKHEALEDLQRYDNVKFHVAYQDEQHGDGHAILQANHWVGDSPIAVLFGDDLIIGEQNGLQQLVDAWNTVSAEHRPHSPMLALENVQRDHVHRYGIADVDNGASAGRLKRIKGLVEKPAPENTPSTLGVVGKYIIPRSVFDRLPTVEASHGGEIRLIDAMIQHLDDHPVYGYEFQGLRYDTGHPEGYKKAVWDLG